MTVPPVELELAADFPDVTRDEWRRLVLGVLRKSGIAGEGTGPGEAEDLIATSTYEGISIRPLYDAADGAALDPAGLPGLAPFVRGGRPQGANTDGWDVRALHAHPDPKATAQAVLADLENGVTSLWLRLGPAGLPVDGLAEVLREVYLDLAPVVLDAGPLTGPAAEAFLALAGERGVPASQLSGVLGADPLGLTARTGAAPDFTAVRALAPRVAAEYPRLRTVVVDARAYHDAGGSDAEELGASIAAGVAYLRELTGAGLGLAEALGQLEFRYAVSADQFLTIAKLRAARRLWARVAEVCGAAPEQRAQRQHAVTSSAMMTRRDPWVNMLRTTVACFGAGVGGADAVTVLPFDARLGLADDFSRRIARNTQTLLQEESSLIRVVDPAGGSWYVESLTDQLAAAAWAVFTEIERAGGIAAALADGSLRARLAATWAARADALAHRRDPLTGVSEFPNLAESLPSRTVAPAEPVAAGGLPAITYDQDYEELRARSDAHLAATGARPVVFLATIGSVSAFTGRSTFAANLFQAGGLETPAGGPGTDPAAVAAAFTASGAKVACLCSADKVYAEWAAPVAEALRAAGAARVWLAGKAGARAETDAAAGVTGYVFAGCNAVEVLRTTLAEAGVA
ncbi:methylmalonyl-CoA mutase small subunit [Parafrankia colletiae]|uniref:Methylmalonyl-CoA mutase small subunit n=1 Tax=Parafrankia colletiae TaxID=573497 RepID=A0A1S1RM96_9ACTN|nr:methylmalonyl-CoA mutase small subunit [Parafrankia colletiae]MCK9904556.1 methylmalonyl-CoA mutase small subunit [Frankia sp. Cpl3]OHV46412.1 methylmalonyl-CoA mutase small subunit [Parafrankia colletiae]